MCGVDAEFTLTLNLLGSFLHMILLMDYLTFSMVGDTLEGNCFDIKIKIMFKCENGLKIKCSWILQREVNA